jgi:hypothetical protein
LDTERSAKNKIQTTGTLAIPVLIYSFGSIKWHLEEIQKLDRKTMKMLIGHGHHHPRADTNRLYVPRKVVGRELMQIEGVYIADVMKLMEHAENKKVH